MHGCRSSQALGARPAHPLPPRLTAAIETMPLHHGGMRRRWHPSMEPCRERWYRLGNRPGGGNAMPESSESHVMERLDRLERENRMLRRIGAIGLAIVAGGLLLGS